MIGVGKKKGKTLGQSADNYALIPITVFLKQYGSHNNSIGIWGKAQATGVPLNEAMDEARVALRAHRHDRPGEDDSFEIETNASLLGIWSGRKALGARRDDVLLQFLIESVVLALVGGALGVICGASVATLVTLAIGMPSSIKLWAVVSGLLVAASVGVFFGVYPARKAARLDPIVALRFEM